MTLLCAVWMSTTGFGQTKEATIKKTMSDHSAGNVVHGYGCPVCLWNSASAGKCAFHNVDLIPDGKYYCKTDPEVVADKPANCHRCGSALLRMETGIMPRPGFVALQDTTRKKTEELGNDPGLERQMNKDPDNRKQPKPKTAPAATDTLAPGKQ
jgi:hypothetical protein